MCVQNSLSLGEGNLGFHEGGMRKFSSTQTIKPNEIDSRYLSRSREEQCHLFLRSFDG